MSQKESAQFHQEQDNTPFSPDMKLSSFSPDPQSGIRNIHIDDVKQNRIDREVADAVAEHGGLNYIQAKYVSQLCDIIANSQDLPPDTQGKLQDLQPKIKIELVNNEENYRRALCISIAFLKRYKMFETIEAVKKEFPQTPKATGFSKVSELDRAFDDLFQAADHSQDVSFNVRARDFKKKVARLYEDPPMWLNENESCMSPRSIRSLKSKKSPK